MIWGMTLYPGVVYTRDVMTVEYLTLASLDCRPEMSTGGSNPMAFLKLQTNDMECILCTLEKGIVHQQSLDYVLQDGDNLKFTVGGNSVVYITGYSYRHPVVSDRIPNRRMSSGVVKIAPNGIHSDLSPASSVESEERQPRIIEGTVASVKSEPLNVNMQGGQDGSGDQAESQVEEFLTGTDEDSTEPEEILQERPNPGSADISGVQESTEEESDEQINREVSIVTETITEGTVDYQDTDTSGPTDTSIMGMETGEKSDFQPHKKTTLPNEMVAEGATNSHDNEDHAPLPDSSREQIQQATDQGLVGANISSAVSDTETTEGAVACLSLNDEIKFCRTGEDTVEEGVGAVESLSNKEVRDSSEVIEEFTELEVRESVKGSNESECENEDLVSHFADLKMKKITIVLHRIDKSTLCSSGERADDCIGHQAGGNDSLYQVETEACEEGIENQIPEKKTSAHASDIEMANILLEFHSGDWTDHLEESSFNANMGAFNCREIRTGDRGTENQTCSISPDISNAEERFSHSRGQESEVLSAVSSQEMNEFRQEMTVSPNKGPVSTCSLEETADDHMGQHTNQKKLPKQLHRKQGLNSTPVERRLRSETNTEKKRKMVTSLQGSAPSQDKKIKKRTLIRRKNRTQPKVVNSRKVVPSKRKVLVNDTERAGNKLKNINSGKKSYSCQFCKKIFARNVDLIVHERSHKEEKSFQCRYCEKTFAFQSYLLRHERGHTGEKPFSCKFCDKKFGMKSNVVAHERIHTGKYPFKCNFCEKKFAVQSKKKYHENIHTGEKLFECKYCGKKFTMNSFLVCHERIHTGEKPFNCNYCEKKFVQKSQMVKHERTHTGEKPFSCKYCTKKFAVKTILKYHERTHTGEKTFKCEYCSRTFTWRKNWIDHTKIHTGERPFSCKYCDKKFFQKIILLQHEAVHTGEKQFKCKYCEKGFAWKNNLMRHERLHTGKKGVA